MKLYVPSCPIVDGATESDTDKLVAGEVIMIEIPLSFYYFISFPDVFVYT